MSTEPVPGAGTPIGPGTRLREWEVRRFLGRGSFGTVWEAQRSSWVGPTEPRALKVFDPVLSGAARHALVQEFDALRSVTHPHVLVGDDAFDVTDGPHAGCVVFVTELAEEDLGGRTQRAGRLPAAEVAAIGAQVAEGLAALHDRDRIHGDVKPENILRVGATWKLGDFGLSTDLDGSYAVASGATVDFRPPEHATAPAGTRLHRSADVWALGVTLHVAATGRHPFVGADPAMRLAASLRDDRSAVAIDDPALRDVVDGACLRPSSRDRAPATEVANRLRAVAEGWGTAAVVAAPTPVSAPAQVVPAPVAPAEVAAEAGPAAPPVRTTPEGPVLVAASTVTAVVAAEVAARVAGATSLDLAGRRAVYAGLLVALLLAVGLVARRLGPTPPAPWPALAAAAGAVGAVVSTLVLLDAGS